MNSIDIFPWNDSFNTGITLIDEQHRKLADLINLLASHVAFNANIPSLNVIFDELAEYAVYHFDTEEKIWHEYMPEDSFETDHLKVHSSFLNEVLRLKTEEETKPVSKVIEDILAFLTRWLAAHILESDRAMAMVVIAMQSGMPLEAAKKHASEQMRGATKVLIDIILSIYESLSTNTLHLMRELAEQKRMQILLNDQERHFEVLLSTTPVGIFESDINGKCMYVNAQWSKITGLSIENAKGDSWVKALHPEDKDKIFTEWTTSTAENRPFHLEYRFLHPNGKTIWVLGKSAIYKSQLNDQYGYVGTITDITERKNSELALVESRNLLNTIIDNAPIRVFWKDTNLRYLGCNTAFANDAGFMHPSEVTGKDDYQMGWAEQADLYRADDLAVIQSGNAKISFDEPQTTPDGKFIWLRTSKIPLKNKSDETLGVLGVYEDITERKEAELRLIASEKLARVTVDLSPIPLALNDKNGNITYLNGAFIQIIGYTLNEIPTLNEWWPLAYPDITYRQEVIENWQKNFTEAAINDLPFTPMEINIQCKDNTVRTFICNAANLTSGHTDTHIVSFFDITERKQVESAFKIAATIFESQEGMMVTDANSIILRVNSAFTKITGYSTDDVVGQTPRILSSGRHGKDFYAAMWESIKDTGAWEGEIWNRRKNGDIYPEHLTITSVKDASGVVNNYVATLTDITMSKAAAEKIKTLAFYDPLTQLPNRRLLLDRLSQALAASTRSGQRGALLFMDLDHFKILNDTLGHDLGDILLQQVAARLTASVREGDTVSRLGGDEFVVLLEDLSEDKIEAASQTQDVAEKIMLTLNQPYKIGIHNRHSTPSIGASLFNGHEQTSEELLKQADIAMYQSKTEGRNTLRFFDPKMQEAITNRVDLELELRKAIELKQFELHYQIQVGSSGQAIGAEALIRWQHPERGMISPFNFIPLAEESGLILPIGQWVLDTACTQLKVWQQSPLTQDLVLAVNVSAKQFFQVGFVEKVLATVQHHAINPTRLKLELTESLLVNDISGIAAKMKVLNQTGIRFSLDDFGTGYSSLQYLKLLPIDQLKIDQSFVRDINQDASDRAIVVTIIHVAHGLGINVIAEGVETEAQRQFLLDNDCTHYQGYLFGKPVPIDEFEALLRKFDWHRQST